MSDEEKLRQLYEDMYAAMVAKDAAELDRVHDDSFVLVHMTGMRQDKQTYMQRCWTAWRFEEATHKTSPTASETL